MPSGRPENAPLSGGSGSLFFFGIFLGDRCLGSTGRGGAGRNGSLQAAPFMVSLNNKYKHFLVEKTKKRVTVTLLFFLRITTWLKQKKPPFSEVNRYCS